MATVLTIIGPTIAAGETLSNAIDCRSGIIIRVFVPPEWTYAPLSFLFSPDNIMPYATICNADGRERILQVQPNSIVLGEINVGGWLKFRSGTGEKQVPQRVSCQFRVATI